VTDYSLAANQYAQDVVNGRIAVCRDVQLACKRHLSDLEQSLNDPQFPYKFSPKRGNKVCAFGEMLPLTGAHGGKGRTLKLQPWQCFFLCNIFGWLQRKDNLRRFRTVYLYVPRKNGKSYISAVIGLYMLLLDGEQQAEVYCGATTQKQAEYVFKPAQQIIRKTPGLIHMGVVNFAQAIVVPATESRMEQLIGNPPDGSSPSCALLDESHEWPNDSILTTMQTGMAARQQPMTVVTTTAGYNTAGPAKLMQEDARDVLEGLKQDDQLFALMYGLDAGDDWKTEAALRKANPNLAVMNYDYLLGQQAKAIQTIRLQTPVKTKHFNVWCASAVGWIDLDKWHVGKNNPVLTLDDFKGEECWAGLDLATKIDLTAYVLLFRRLIDGVTHYYLFPRFYLPAAKIDDPANGHYKQWSELGYLEAVPGNSNSHEELLVQITQDSKKFEILEVAHDPMFAHMLINKLVEARFVTAEIPQTAKYLSEPMKEMEALILDERFHHDGNPVMTWCIANTTMVTYKNQLIAPDKARDEKKTDGTVATMLALSRAALTIPKKKQSWDVEVW
jgi:phage terminase large subunit-like protein